jgi:acetyl esterase/lipase
VSLAALAACSAHEVRAHVIYDARRPDTSIMDVYLPTDGKSARPAVLLVHGGSWRSGKRGDFTLAAGRLADSGYVAATIDYRLSPEHVYPAAVQDCFCALAFLRAHAGEYGLDPDRVVAMGYSAGGHLVSLLGLAADVPAHQDCPGGVTGPPASVISGAGPQDLLALIGDGDGGVVEDFVGAPPSQVEVWRAASPSSYVRGGVVPFLFIHAEGDLIVPVGQSRSQRDALRASGNHTRLLTLAGGGHLLNEGVDPGHEYLEASTDGNEAWAVIFDWLSRTSGGSP